MNEGAVVIPLDADHQNSSRFQSTEDLLGLAQMRRFHRWSVKKVARNQKNVRLLFNGLGCHKTESRRQVRIR